MRVVLLADIPKLGKRGEVKEVAPGYARNFLMPQNLAEPATSEAVSQAEAVKVRSAKLAVLDLEKTEELAKRLAGHEVTIKAKANDEGKLYAAVTSAKISAELKANGFEVHKSQVLTEPIKELGEQDVTISLNHGLEAQVSVSVISE